MIRSKLVQTDIKLYELFLAFLAGLRADGVDIFEEYLKCKAGVAGAVVFGSGNAAFCAALKVASTRASDKNEVLLPAYTPLALYVAVKQAGLKPVLCDISLTDFGYLSECFSSRIGAKTLAAINVRLFGLENAVPGKNDGLFVIEDNAQGFITPLKWDMELLSFNRGKNFPLLNGGALLSNDEDFLAKLREVRDSYSKPGFFANISMLAKMKALSVSRSNLLYNLLLPVISAFRENSAPVKIALTRLTGWQGMLGTAKLSATGPNSEKRFKNAKMYLELLKDCPGIRLPEIKEKSIPNRFPVFILDERKVGAVGAALLKNGVESSRMYLKTVAEAFNDPEIKGDFKNAEYIAKHLLVLPCHPFLLERDIVAAAEGIKKCFH